jgi:hypothetical protein
MESKTKAAIIVAAILCFFAALATALPTQKRYGTIQITAPGGGCYQRGTLQTVSWNANYEVPNPSNQKVRITIWEVNSPDNLIYTFPTEYSYTITYAQFTVTNIFKPNKKYYAVVDLYNFGVKGKSSTFQVFDPAIGYTCDVPHDDNGVTPPNDPNCADDDESCNCGDGGESDYEYTGFGKSKNGTDDGSGDDDDDDADDNDKGADSGKSKNGKDDDDDEGDDGGDDEDAAGEGSKNSDTKQNNNEDDDDDD